MDFTFSDEQTAVRDLAAQIMDGRGPTDQDSGYPHPWPDRGLWGALADAGLLGIAVPEAHGGAGQGITELSLLLVELGRGVANVPAWSTLAVAAPAIARHGDEALRERWLARVAGGSAILSAALTEPQQVDPRDPRTVAAPDGAGGYVLTGTKIGVPLADTAAAILTTGRTPDGVPVVVLLDPAADGVGTTLQRTTDGEPSSQLDLRGVRVPAAGVVATGAEALADIVDIAQVGRAALQLGVAERALEMTAGYVSTREQFGRPIGTFQAVACRTADAYIDVQSMRATLQQATWRLDAGLPAREEVAVAAFWAADGARRVLAAAVHLHGGMGVDTDYPLHHYFLRAKHLEVLLGSATATLVDLGDVLASAS